MKSNNLRSAVASVTQNKRVRAIALEVIGMRASVKISGSSQVLYGIPITGGNIVAGQEVYVDYTTGTPVVHSYTDDSSTSSTVSRTKVRTVIPDPDIPSSSSNFIEAPIDNKSYARKNAGWSEITSGSGTSGSGIEEAPINDKSYVRRNATWVEETSGSSSNSGVTDHTLLSNIGVNTHDQIDTALTRLANTSGSNTGDQTLAGLGGIGDAPADSKEYLRKNNAWIEHTSGSGTTSGSGIEEAPIDGKEYVRKDAGWIEHTSGSQTSGSGVDNFLDLSDTPNSYSGQASKVVSVKSDETGLEFTTVSSGEVPAALKIYLYNTFK